jgi:hypothetical protein
MNIWTQYKNLQLCVLTSRLRPTCHRLRGLLLSWTSWTWGVFATGLRAPWPWEGILAAAMGEKRRGMAPQQRPKESPSRGGEMAWGKRRERAGAAIYRAKLWTCQVAVSSGRWKNVDIGRPFLAFSACFRTLVAVEDFFFDVHSTNLV